MLSSAIVVKFVIQKTTNFHLLVQRRSNWWEIWWNTCSRLLLPSLRV